MYTEVYTSPVQHDLCHGLTARGPFSGEARKYAYIGEIPISKTTDNLATRSILLAAQALEEAAHSKHLADQIEAAAELVIVSDPGKVVVSGMGKAGIIGRKLAATLSSTATPAVFVHPGEAAHGDLGVVHQDDCVIALSTSGKTRELHEFLEHMHDLQGCPAIGITSHPEELEAYCDGIIEMPVVHEADTLGLVPTTSTLVMLAICDALAITIMYDKNVEASDFALRHHGGYLGEKSRERS